MGALMLGVEVLSLALVPRFDAAGMQATQNPSNPINSVVYIAFILVFTGVMLAVMKYGMDWVLRGVILLSAGSLSYYALSVLLPLPFALLGGAGVAVLLYLYPEWYVIDSAAVLMGGAGGGLFGISFGVLPSLVLLVLLAVYDAIAVYRTKHMLALAEGVSEMRLPILFIVPTKPGYSFIEASKQGDPTGTGTGGDGDEDDETSQDDRDAFFMGLGDAVIPSVLIASSAHFLGGDLGLPIALNYPALGGIVGSFVGFAALMYLVSKGKPHAGLPLLNGGTIAGFVVGVLALGTPLPEAVGVLS
ncbi:MAG: presenilin family intramembrane aspartyl protease PSH [Halobacteria archaeon]|nr:presenilin family intramembrane aspartyl protease PSH [Halobacteria archaeon]